MKQSITISGREGLLYECGEHPQVLLIQPLGEREEFAKNKAIAQVGNNVRWEYDHLQRTIGSDHCTLVWEKGGHFVTPHLRLARAFAWCVKSLMK